MKLAEALAIVTKAPADGQPLPIVLACGFTPLHLQNYLAAYVQQQNPSRKVRVETGLFGDLPGTVAKFVEQQSALGVLVIEWQDLDARLGYRQTGGWGQRVVPSILENVRANLNLLEKRLASIASASKLVVSLPTLDLPPAFHTSSWQMSEAEAALASEIASFGQRIAAHPSIVLLNAQRLAAESPAASRYDFRSDLNTGFPYTQAHAEALSRAYALLMQTPTPKKGLITDLDDTLWLGLVGEIGPDEISWNLVSHSQPHGLYQQALRALAEQGVLIAIASKNSADVVRRALARKDLVVDPDKIFPVEVHWEAKSGSVARILKTWNISADSVVFVDDSSMELAEVKAAHPDIECLQFPRSDYPAGLALLQRLRDLFGKPRLSEEDAYRLQSIRQGVQFSAPSSGEAASDLLASAEAVLTLEFSSRSVDKRVVELVNKTNQFNLNGRRFSEGEWLSAFGVPDTFAVSISYQDKFGPLGKIGAVLCRRAESRVVVETWVMSCRAFSRQIEYQTVAQLFRFFGADEISFDFEATNKNQPLADFLQTLLAGQPMPGSSLHRNDFQALCPTMHHQILLQTINLNDEQIRNSTH